MQKKKKKSPLLTLILMICLGVIAFAAYKVISIQMVYSEGQQEYAELQQYVTVKEPKITTAPAQTKDKEQETQEETQGAASQAPIEVDCKALKAQNPDFVGWIYVGAEDISYPVVHSDDNDTYLHMTFDKTYNFAGCIFMEALNNPDWQDPHTILYGHNMKDRSMFGRLKFLQLNGDYQNDPYFWIFTEDATYKYKIFSTQFVPVNSNIWTLFTGPSDEFVQYIKERKESSAIQTDMGEYDKNSKIVTLSTCYSLDGSDRFVVQGILEEVIQTK